MKFELDLVRAAAAEAALHARPAGTAPARKAIRHATDAVIFDALYPGALPRLVAALCDVMLTVAQVVDDHDVEPGVQDFVDASVTLIEQARNVVDRGLALDTKDDARRGAVMLELVVRGMCAALSVDYEAAMRAVHAGEAPPVPGSNPSTEQTDAFA